MMLIMLIHASSLWEVVTGAVKEVVRAYWRGELMMESVAEDEGEVKKPMKAG